MHRTPQEAREWAAGLLAGAGHLRNAAADLAGTVVTLAARVAVYEAALGDVPEAACQWAMSVKSSEDLESDTIAAAQRWAADVRADADAAAMLVRR